MHINRPNTGIPSVFMNISQGFNVTQIPQNAVMKSTSTKILNGKKIVTITETINGVTTIKTITSHLN